MVRKLKGVREDENQKMASSVFVYYRRCACGPWILLCRGVFDRQLSDHIKSNYNDDLYGSGRTIALGTFRKGV